jgi:hypothetical protein
VCVYNMLLVYFNLFSVFWLAIQYYESIVYCVFHVRSHTWTSMETVFARE